MATDDRFDDRSASLSADELAARPGGPDGRSGGVTVDDLGARAVELTAELVAIDSVNPGLVPGSAGEGAIVEHLRDRLQGSGSPPTSSRPRVTTTARAWSRSVRPDHPAPRWC